MNPIDIADLDCIYLSYDEPEKEEYWVRIKNMVPWARRVDGVLGSDAAHKAAAQASDTERFILIDGDNIPDPVFFNQTLNFPTPEYEQAVFRWRARNHVNGLMYGNGGLSSWTRTHVMNMRTHENTDGRDETVVEFCFDPLYWAMHDCYSTTYPNQSPFHAWRAGFREGVKMTLDRGKRQEIINPKKQFGKRNYQRLLMWCSVGSDIENGLWSIYGARLGCYMTNCTDWDYVNVRDFKWLNSYWAEHDGQTTDKMLPFEIMGIGETLKHELAMSIADPFTVEQSKLFKSLYTNPPRMKNTFIVGS